MTRQSLAMLLGLSLMPMASAANAAVYAPATIAEAQPTPALELVQYYRPRGYAVAPRYYAAPRYVPGRAYFAPRGYYGRPYWFARPWNVRPYYGTIIGGVALGTLITVAAIGYVPPRPAPNLCWYWADPDGAQGYWDYCS